MIKHVQNSLPSGETQVMQTTVFRSVLVGLLCLILSACVTTTNSPYTSKANEQEALVRYVDLGLEYVKRGEYTRARKHIDRSLEIDSDYAPAHGVLGLIFQRDGEYRLAEESFKEALSQDSGYTRGHTYYGALLFSQERFSEAKKQFEKASEDVAFESRAQVFTNIALCEIRLGNPDAAIEAYKRSLRLDRMNGRALSGITELYLNKNQVSEANRYYARLISMVAQQGLRHTPQTLWQGIRIAYALGNVGQAQTFASMLGELYPDSPEYAEYQSLYVAG